LMLENIEDGYYEVDLVGNLLVCNESARKVLGYAGDESVGLSFRHYMDKENYHKAIGAFNAVYRTGQSINIGELEVIRKDGTTRHVEISISLMRDDQGQPAGFRGIVRDVTDRKLMQEKILALSITDQLTGLYNRRGFMALAEQQLKVAERSNTRLLLLFADVDDLKSINDKLGHLKGDDAIVEAATILKEIFRESDIIARVGGDEFVVLAYGVSTESTGVPEYRLQEQMDAHNARENRDYNISMSIGIVYKDPDWPCSIDELMSHADALMYQQKKLRKIEESRTPGILLPPVQRR